MAAKRRRGEARGAAGAGERRARSAADPAALRVAWWLAAAALALPALVVVPPALDAFRLPQRMLAEWLALASLVSLSLGRGRGGETPGTPLWRRPAAAAVAPLLLVATAGLLATAHRAHVAEALVDLWIGAAALVGWAWGFPAPRRRRLLDVAALAPLPTAVIAVLQAHDLWQPVSFAVDPGGERLAITSLAGNPGDLAALLVLPALVCQANLVRAAGGWRWAWMAVLLVHVYALAATRTLTSLAALAAGSALLWLLALPPRRAVLATAAAVAGLALVVAAVPPLRGRLVAQGEVLRRGDLDTLLTGRLDGWRVAARLLAEHPLAGVGHGAYRAEFARAKLDMAAEGQTFYAGHLRPSFANAHNEYLEVGAELGWPGLLALVWGSTALVLAARRAWRAAERRDAALAWAGLGAIALLSLAYFPFRLGPVAFAWVAFLAWSLGPARAAGEEAGRSNAALRRAAIALLLLALLGQGVRGLRRVQSSALTAAVQQQVGLAQRQGRLAAPLLRGALAALARARQLDPVAVEPRAFEGDLLLVVGQEAAAVEVYRRVAAHELRPETLRHWGQALWQQGRREEAMEQWRRVQVLAPLLAHGLPVPLETLAAQPLTPLGE